MRQIDVQSWSRRAHFERFRDFDHPHFSICANVNLIRFRPDVMDSGFSFTTAIVYVLTRAANSVPQFRYRIRGDGVVEHEVVHPSFTVLANGDVFGYCRPDYTDDFSLFAERVSESTAKVRENPSIVDDPEVDDRLYMSAMPWLSFTSVTHPMNLKYPDSVPRIAWGKFFDEGKELKMPLSVQAHHALMDGIHIGRFYSLVQELLDNPAVFLSQR